MESIKHIIEEYAQGKIYFSIDELKKNLKSKRIAFTDETVKKYLYNRKHNGQIFSAGRGWYSTIEKYFELDTEPVLVIIEKITKEFPLLSFTCWSTEQIKYYFHHLQTSFVTFVYSDSDSLGLLFDSIREQYENVYLNPRQDEVRKNFVIKEKTIILRPSITEEPHAGYFATIEKILVDLYLEKDRMVLIDGSEYDRIFKNVVTDSRINVSRLLRYAKRREVKHILRNKIH